MIKSDNGSEFKGVFKDLCEELRVRHHTTLPYHPQSNGLAERFVRTVKSYVVRFAATHEETYWETIIP